MTPAKLNLTVRKGITFGPVVINCKDADGEPVDLTGWSVYADARTSLSSAVAFSLQPTITNAAEGEITIDFTDEQAQLLPNGKFYWDLVLENPDGVRLGPYVAGEVSVLLINTRPS